MSNNNKTIKIASVSGVLFTCSYKSSNLFLGSLSWDTWGSIASHLPLLISAINVSTLSTVFKETWHSLCNVWNVWCKEFSLQNWSTILITLKRKQQKKNYNTASTSRVAKTLITSRVDWVILLINFSYLSKKVKFKQNKTFTLYVNQINVTYIHIYTQIEQ